MNLEECLREGFLRKVEIDKKLIEKEMKEAEYDFKMAEKEFESKDFKWAIVKSYYSMFHASRAVLFSLGFREKRHFAVQVVLDDLNKKGKLESIYLEYFGAAMEAREGADYRYVYSENIAKDVLEYAEKFIEKMKEISK